MKRLWKRGERMAASEVDAADFFDGTSFLVRGTRVQASGTRRQAGSFPGQPRCVPRVGRRAPAHAGCAPSIAGDVSGLDRCMKIKMLYKFIVFIPSLTVHLNKT